MAALAIVESFDDIPGGWYGPLTFAIAVVLVRVMHLVIYAVAAGDDRGLLLQLVRTAVPVALFAALLIAGSFLDPPAQLVVWAVAVVVDYAGIYLTGAEGWRLNAPAHFAERHGLIIIIALGESIVALGVGAADEPVSGPLVTAVVLGLGIAVALWWAYFDVVAPVAEKVLHRAEGAERARLARDSYTYLHFPMVAGIVFLALGLKKVIEYVADTEHHDLTDPLTGIPLLALYGGVALYLLAHVAVPAAQPQVAQPAACGHRRGAGCAGPGGLAAAGARVTRPARGGAGCPDRLRVHRCTPTRVAPSGTRGTGTDSPSAPSVVGLVQPGQLGGHVGAGSSLPPVASGRRAEHRVPGEQPTKDRGAATREGAVVEVLVLGADRLDVHLVALGPGRQDRQVGVAEHLGVEVARLRRVLGGAADQPGDLGDDAVLDAQLRQASSRARRALRSSLSEAVGS